MTIDGYSFMLTYHEGIRYMVQPQVFRHCELAMQSHARTIIEDEIGKQRHHFLDWS